MFKKGILIVFIIFGIMCGISAVSAETTNKIYFKDGNFAVEKNFPKANKVSLYYWTKVNQMNIMIHGKTSMDSCDYKVTGATVVFKKKVGKKILYSTKKFTNSNLKYAPKNGYKPYYAIISYKKLFC